MVRLRVFDKNEREEVAQAVRLRLARTLFRQSSFDVPFFAIVPRSLCDEFVDFLRRHWRRDDATDELPPSPADAPADLAERDDVLADRRLRDALAQLHSAIATYLGRSFSRDSAGRSWPAGCDDREH